MPQGANLTLQIQECLDELQHTALSRRQIQSALVQQLQIPILLLGGICLGIFFHTAACSKSSSTSISTQFILWLWRFWLGRSTATRAVSKITDNN